NICCDAEGWVYVADRENHRVELCDGNGKYETQWNNMHRPSGLYREPRAQGRFYVGEIGAGMAVNNDMPNIGPRVSIYSGKGQLLARRGDARGRGHQPGGARAGPVHLAPRSRGRLARRHLRGRGLVHQLGPPRADSARTAESPEARPGGLKRREGRPG